MDNINYLVTARKWRPKIFDNVVGQEHITNALKNAIKFNKIAHAFIFCGPRGIGKTSTARILAKTLNCPNAKDFNPCNECEICLSINEGNNMDVIEIDGASNRGIDEIRTLRESVKFAPTVSKYKVYIIDEVHMLTTHSFNALLKTLEEPPPNVIFILATTDVHKVPTTILSRCQKYNFRRLTMNEIKNQLKFIADQEKIKYDDDALSIIAKKADGAMRDAQSLFDQLVVYSQGNLVYENVNEMLGIIDYEYYFKITDCLINQDVERVFQIVDEVYFKGLDLLTFVDGLIEHFRNILTLQLTNDLKYTDLSENMKERLKSLSIYFKNKLKDKDVVRILALLSRGLYDLKNSSNQKLTLEVLLVQLLYLPSSVVVEKVIDYLAKIKPDGGLPVINITVENSETKIPVKNTYTPEVKEDVPKKEIVEKETPITKVSEMIQLVDVSDPVKIGFDEIKEQWKDFLVFVNKKRNVFSALLKGAYPSNFSDNYLDILVPDKNNAEKLKKSIKILDQLTTDFWKEKISCNIIHNSEISSSVTPEVKSETTNGDKDLENNYLNGDIEAFIRKELGGELM